MINYLEYIIDNELWKTNRLLPTRQFIDYCKKRKIITKKDHLVHLEKLDIFYPIARRISYCSKDNAEESDIISLEKKNDPELWEETATEKYIPFDFYKEISKEFSKRGLLWQPSILKKDIDDQELTRTESYYSKFQCYRLANIIAYTRSYLDYIYENITETFNIQARNIQRSIMTFKNCTDLRQNPGIICQIISDRYYPQTLSDRRSFIINKHNYYDWNWYDYKILWDAKKVLADLELEPEDIESCYRKLYRQAEITDPLEHWHDLIEFVAVRKKEKLKGHALYAQELYRMAKMLSLFYEEITGKPPKELGDSRKIIRNKIYGIGVYDDTLKYLTFLTNEYHLNPRPKLILVVEGESEELAIPDLIERFFGYELSTLGIYIWNIKGVDNFAGKKKDSPYSALEKFIDYNHHTEGILVYVMLDKENKVDKIVNRLLNKCSIFNSLHSITKSEYCFLFDPAIELHMGNFSDEEIAESLTKLCGSEYYFKANEIEKCREIKNNEQMKALKKLYNQKAVRELNKPELLKILISNININNKNREKGIDGKYKRPILNVIKKIIGLAFKNRDVSTDKYMMEKLRNDFFHDFF